MNKAHAREHTVDFVFALALFFVFAASALAVVLLSLQSYQSITAGEDSNYTLRTGISYVSQKIRHMDRENAVAAGSLEGLPALVLTQEFGGAPYTTYIYCYEGALKELFVKQDAALSPKSGKTILPLNSFTVEESAPGLFRFTLETPDGNVHTLDTALRT